MSRTNVQSEVLELGPEGERFELFTLEAGNCFRLRVMNYGAIVLSLEVPDRGGSRSDVVLGLQSPEAYLKGTPYFGAVVGRYGNRIADGSFELDGTNYSLARNNAPGGVPCALHGGVLGFDKVFWRGSVVDGDGGQGVRFTHMSPDGDEGYPGKLEVSVTYWLKEDGDGCAWQIDYAARTDRATPVNLTQHSFFNLKGEGMGDVLDHELQLPASHYTPVGVGMIPTGELASVEGTPLDFRLPAPLRDRVDADFEQLRLGGGIDHNFVSGNEAGEICRVATVFEPTTGRTLDVFTTEPGIQVYTGNFLDGSMVGKSGRAYGFRQGFCLETQHFPDSPNQPHFPSTILRPGGELRSMTVYRFGVRE